MNKVNVIRHLAFEDLDGFSEVFAQRGLAVRYFEAGLDDLDPLQADNNLLVVLGGPISVNDTGPFPFLREEIELLRRRVIEDRPTLGICLGAQLIARALGASVYPGTRKEIGWSPLVLTEEGERSVLQQLEPSGFNVLHWHGETFDLPRGATLLAGTSLTPNQAFSVGRSILALQFHVEVSARGLERWYIGHIGEIQQTPGVSVDSLRGQAGQYAGAAELSGRSMLQAWLDSLPPSGPG